MWSSRLFTVNSVWSSLHDTINDEGAWRELRLQQRYFKEKAQRNQPEVRIMTRSSHPGKSSVLLLDRQRTVAVSLARSYRLSSLLMPSLLSKAGALHDACMHFLSPPSFLSSALLFRGIVADTIWDDTPDLSKTQQPVHAPLTNPNGSNVTIEKLRGIRLFGYDGCSRT